MWSHRGVQSAPRSVSAKPPPDQSLIVIGIVGAFVLVIGALSLCTAFESQCRLPLSRDPNVR